MIQCARCAAANQPTSKYCLTCGSPLPAAAQPAAPAAAPTAPPPAPAPAWGPPGYGGPPPGYGAPPPQHGAAPPQPYPSNAGQNYQAAPAAPPPQYSGSEADRLRFGSPDGLNPYGATVGPSAGLGGYSPPPAPAPVNPHSNDPSAFAPTAPPVRDEYDPYRAPAQPPAAQAYNPPAAAPYNPAAAPYNPAAAPYNPAAAPYNPPPAPAYNPPPPPGAYAPQPQQPPQYAPQQPVAHQAPAYAQPPPPAPAYAQAYAPQPAAPVPQPGLQANPSRPPPVATGRDPEQLEAGAPRALAGFLVSYEGNDLGAFWPLHQGQNQLGRKGAAPGLDIEIDHPTTSSRHAVLYASARPARLKLEDSGSTNGTFLKDQQLERGKRYEVEDGDVVRFGGFTTIVKLV